MAANTLAPTGLVFNRNLSGAAPTYQANQYKIRSAYATKIGLGDLVRTGAAGDAPNQGYVISVTTNTGTILGVFAGLLPYYDTNLQNTVFLQWWTGTASPSADVDCLVVDDYLTTFRAQASGVAWAQTWRGQNIGILTATNASPNISGISTLTLDSSSINTTSTLPFRVLNAMGVSGGPQDPANSNPWIEVTFNPGQLERLGATGL